MNLGERNGADAATPAPKKRPQTAAFVNDKVGPGVGGSAYTVAQRVTPVNTCQELITVHVAGTCRPDPGGAGRWSWLAFGDMGELLATSAGELGAWAGMTEAYATYTALIQALTWAEEHGARVELATDASAVIAQTLGRAPTPGPLYPLRIEAARRLVTTLAVLRYVSPDRNRARQGGPA